MEDLKSKKLLFAPWAGSNKNYMSYQTFFIPTKKIFKNIIYFDPQKELNRHGKHGMNMRFLELIKKERPDYVLLWLIYDEFYLDTLIKIKKICPNIKLISYCGDDDTLFENYTIFYSLIIDYFLVTHREFLNKYKNKAFMSLAIDSDNFKPKNLEKKYDVSFVGTPKVDRPEYIKYLRDNGIKVKVFGGGWENYPELKDVYGGAISSEEYVNVLNQTKINLCFTKNFEGEKHLNQHSFEAGACDSFVLTEESKEYAHYFKEGKNFVSFKDKDDLLKKVRYYLKNEKQREEIQKKFHKVILDKFSKDKEFKYVFDTILSDKKKRDNLDIFTKEYKVSQLIREDLKLNTQALKNKLKDSDYIIFKTKGAKDLKYRNTIQVFSLNEFNKPISCCDYYINSKSLGNYLLFMAKRALKLLDKKDFYKLLNINQLMVRKDYFLKNKSKFQDLFDNKNTDLINFENTAFISIPLVQVSDKELNFIEYEKMEKVILTGFRDDLTSLIYHKKLITSMSLYSLIYNSLFRNPFLFRYFLKKISSLIIQPS